MENKSSAVNHPFFMFIVGSLLFALCLVFSCNYDSECKDIDYGRQYMSDSSRTSFAYKGGETLFFKDPIGQELAFLIIPPSVIYPTWLNLAQEPLEGTCAGEIKIRSELQSLVVNFNSDTLDYKIIYVHAVHSLVQEKAPIYYDIMTSDMFQGNQSPVNWHISINHLLDSKGNETYFADNPISYHYTEHIILNGRSFEKVYYNNLPDGSALYFNHELGFVGFKESNKPLWVLDRIE